MFPLLHKGSVLKPYLVGAITGPLVASVVRPLLRGTVKGAVNVGLQVKQLAAEAAEEFGDIAAEARADMNSGDSGDSRDSGASAPAASASASKKR